MGARPTVRGRPQGPPLRFWGDGVFFPRRQVASSTVPDTDAPLTYLSSSAVSELMTRVWVFPFKLGNEPASTLVVMVLVFSSTDQVPILAIMPVITALFSSALPWFALSIAKFGRSAREVNIEYRPLASKMRSPFGFGPRRSDLLPALSVAMIDTSVQAPTSCCLSDPCWLTAPVGDMTSATVAAANRLMMLRRCMGFLTGRRCFANLHGSRHGRKAW